MSPLDAENFSSMTTGIARVLIRTQKPPPRRAGFAARLQRAGLVKGDKVVFWSENRPEWIIALWGCLLNGSIAVPIDYRASHEFLGTRRTHRRRRSFCWSAMTWSSLA